MSEIPSAVTTARPAETGLAALRLSPEEWAAVERCGIIVAEQRACGVIHKLRFRLAGRQRIRYLGSEPQAIDIARQQLAELQRQRDQRRVLDRELRQLIDEGRKQLRASKAQLQPLLVTIGMHFHGGTPRRRRGTSPAAP